MKPTRHPKYLAWIRTLPCLVCGRTSGVEAAHTGPHGIAQKSADTSAIPLCVRHHRTGRDSYHKLGPRAFERRHGLDLRTIVARLNEKPSVRIELGMFVGKYRGEDFVLGPVQMGIQSAIRQVLSTKREDRIVCSSTGADEGTIDGFFRIMGRGTVVARRVED
jgi:hypothetical protein